MREIVCQLHTVAAASLESSLCGVDELTNARNLADDALSSDCLRGESKNEAHHRRSSVQLLGK